MAINTTLDKELISIAIIDAANVRCFLSCVEDILYTPQVQSMKEIRHHPGTSCFDHSLFVSYVAFRLARRWQLDYRAAARAGLLHDLYLYNPKERTFTQDRYEGLQCFAHPRAALKNAWALCGSLSPKEENIIISHMWPLSRRMPRCREAVVVNLADKLCASAEVMGFYRRLYGPRIYAFTPA